jgi:hypothetical protein
MHTRNQKESVGRGSLFVRNEGLSPNYLLDTCQIFFVLNGKFHTFRRPIWRFLLPRYAPLSHPYLTREAEPAWSHYRMWQPFDAADWPVTSEYDLRQSILGRARHN